MRPKDNKISKPKTTLSPVEANAITSVLSATKVTPKKSGLVIEFDIKNQTEAVPQILSPDRNSDPTEAPRLLECSSKRHIYFLKTHKTGSSTVQNIQGDLLKVLKPFRRYFLGLFLNHFLT